MKSTAHVLKNSGNKIFETVLLSTRTEKQDWLEWNWGKVIDNHKRTKVQSRQDVRLANKSQEYVMVRTEIHFWYSTTSYKKICAERFHKFNTFIHVTKLSVSLYFSNKWHQDHPDFLWPPGTDEGWMDRTALLHFPVTTQPSAGRLRLWPRKYLGKVSN